MNNKILSPFQIRAIREEENYSELMYKPLIKGFGHTIGNSLRRILLSSVRGARIISIESPQISHELSTVKGIKEDVVAMCFNFRKVRLYVPGNEIYTLTLRANGNQTVCASDIEVHSGIKILTPEVVLFHIDGEIEIKIIVEPNFGVVKLEHLESYNKDLQGRVYLHDLYFFSPVLNVGMQVGSYILGNKEYDYLTLKVKTDGSVSPISAVSESAKIMQEMLNGYIKCEVSENILTTESKEEEIDQVLFTTISDLGLSTRAENALKNAGIEYLGDILVHNPSSIQNKVSNFGKKSFDEVYNKISSMGYTWNGELEDWHKLRDNKKNH